MKRAERDEVRAAIEKMIAADEAKMAGVKQAPGEEARATIEKMLAADEAKMAAIPELPLELKSALQAARELRTAIRSGVLKDKKDWNNLLHWIIGRSVLARSLRATPNPMGSPPISPGVRLVEVDDEDDRDPDLAWKMYLPIKNGKKHWIEAEAIFRKRPRISQKQLWMAVGKPLSFDSFRSQLKDKRWWKMRPNK